MDWITYYQLFLFDLDGLLINTEEMHFRAYVQACLRFGHTLTWDFPTYFSIAQKDADALQKELSSFFDEPFCWKTFYAEKKRLFLKLLEQEEVPLLAGAGALLQAIQEKKIKHCVVTHSSRAIVQLVRKKQPLLDQIPYWFCREDYERPKPSPDGYLKAIDTLAQADDRIIGFEDSLRGMNALMQTKATAVFVNSIDGETRSHFLREGLRVFKTLKMWAQHHEAG